MEENIEERIDSMNKLIKSSYDDLLFYKHQVNTSSIYEIDVNDKWLHDCKIAHQKLIDERDRLISIQKAQNEQIEIESKGTVEIIEQKIECKSTKMKQLLLKSLRVLLFIGLIILSINVGMFIGSCVFKFIMWSGSLPFIQKALSYVVFL